MKNVRSAVFVSASLLCVASSSAIAGQQPAPPPQQQEAVVRTESGPDQARKPGSLDEVICEVRDKPATGTRITRKREVCRTRREWLEDAENGQATLKKVQDAGGTSNGIKGPGGN